MPHVTHHLDTVAARTRNGFAIVTCLNEKSPKGEAWGYLQAMVYLAPHTLAGGKTVCPHSTEPCRTGCLYTAGRGKTPRVEKARIGRTQFFLRDRDGFMLALAHELTRLQALADSFDLKLAVRLNGTSDIAFEREIMGDNGETIFDLFERAQFFDYTRWPPQHRKVPANWHLTFSLADEGVDFARAHLLAGRSVAAIVPDHERKNAPAWFAIGPTTVEVVDGEQHDLRFLDASPSLVLLRPKGRLVRHPGQMVHRDLIRQLLATNVEG